MTDLFGLWCAGLMTLLGTVCVGVGLSGRRTTGLGSGDRAVCLCLGALALCLAVTWLP